MSTPNGYNNPAYCHQFDSSLYDYQYVPEIDPDSPDLEEESNRRGNHTKLVHPKFKNIQSEFSESDSFEGSDESNRSIIIEECNNRRVTLICEKRSKADVDQDECYEDGNIRGAYYQDISLESEHGHDRSRRKQEERSLRHQRPLEPPVNQGRNGNDRRIGAASSFKQSTISINSYQRPQRLHRYEEIPSEEEYMRSISTSPSVHRYAEISPDENGYPTITKEIKVEETYPVERKVITKPRALSPVSHVGPTSPAGPPPTPTRLYQRQPTQFSPNFSSPFIYCSSPVERNSFEMSELSPPREHDSKYQGNDQTFFIYSPKRQPPIGASANPELQEFNPSNGRCILPKNLQQFSVKSGKDRSQSLPNSPAKRKQPQIVSSPLKTQSDRKIKQIFHIKPVKTSQPKQTPGKVPNTKENHSVRRNISNSFTDPPRENEMLSRSPYKPTTELIPTKTAVITPIFQRKNQQDFFGISPRGNFEKMSHAFQSTGNIFRSTRDQVHPNGVDAKVQERTTRIKRNQSVPNFTQSLAAENRMIARRNQEILYQENQKYPKSLEFQYSPKKQVEHLSPIDKSRISLIDQTRSSWTISDSDVQPSCSLCFIFATIVHLVTATATCAITFYLLSKVGRKYYLDFGLLAGFVNFILGLLGFRSYCWRWIPNRNYVSGFIALAAFSALNCAGLTYIITARPMAGDPILDILGGAICAVSVLTIVLSLTGLTMSGCCKAPPPDNRVTDI